MNKKRYTMKDVAQRAGVTQPTVSHVINGTASISKDVRDRVNRVIEELDYRPNAIAKCLKTKRTNIVGIVIPDMLNDFYTMLVRKLESELQQKGYVTFLACTGYDSSSEERCIRSFMQYNVEGIIVCYQLVSRDLYGLMRRSRMPFVKIEDGTDEMPEKSVDVDNFYGGYVATRYLLGLGRKRIAFISEAMRVNVMQHRLDGYKQALSDEGIEVDDSLIIFSRETTDKSFMGMRLGAEALQKDIDGAFITSDSVAIGVLRLLREQGVKMPEDIAIVSHDDTPSAKFTFPMLTTVVQPVSEIAACTIELLMRQIAGDETTGQELIRGRLVIRETA
jgi:DNA-binding LacI/PurR family transcriptional regulator